MAFKTIVVTVIATLTFVAVAFVLGSVVPEQTPFFMHSFDTVTKLAADVAGDAIFS